jgi:transcriptional regulator with XRE-family HTH domain
MSLADNIKRLRRDHGWTQGDLSEHAGLRIAHISELEKGKGDPKLSTLEKLKEAFRCSYDSLLMDTKQSPTDALLKHVLERAVALEDKEKRFLIHMVDMHCIAVGMVREADRNRSLKIFLDRHEPVIDLEAEELP